jgi:selenocysteine-specific elongation factor
LARLPIDRVFTMKGFGTVVTGSLVAGTVRKEDELELLPSRKRVRVRGVQVHGSPAEAAVAGQRTALNLVGLSTNDLARGMTLATADTFHSASRVDALLSLLPSAKPLKDGARVHFHAYTTETIAEVRLYGTKQSKPGDEAYAQIRFAEPMLLLPQDRFIVRQFSPVLTIGGGVVLDGSPVPRRQRLEDAIAFLKIMRDGSPVGTSREAAGNGRISVVQSGPRCAVGIRGSQSRCSSHSQTISRCESPCGRDEQRRTP